jgi:hypothetical protein
VVRLNEVASNLLPGVIALLVISLFTILLAVMIRAVLPRVLENIDFDTRVSRWGFGAVADWSPARSPGLLLTRIASWTVLVLGLMLGVSALDVNLAVFTASVFAYLPRIIAAAVIFLLGIVVARFIARGVLIGAVNMQIQSARLMSVGVKWLVMVLASAMALDHLRIGGAIVQLAFAILFGGIVLALALAVGLGSKEMVRRSWERQHATGGRESEEDTLRHI